MSLLSKINNLNAALDETTVTIRGKDQAGSFKDDIYQHRKILLHCAILATVFTRNSERRDKLLALIHSLVQ